VTRPLAATPLYYPALYLLATITSVRVMRLKFGEQLGLGCMWWLPFAICVNVGGVGDAGLMSGWLAVCSLMPLIRLYANERIRRRAFADDEASRCAAAVAAERLCHTLVLLFCPRDWVEMLCRSRACDGGTIRALGANVLQGEPAAGDGARGGHAAPAHYPVDALRCVLVDGAVSPCTLERSNAVWLRVHWRHA
jgi:hypothetical protein